MTITYEVYLDCLKIGLVPNPKEIIIAKDVCAGIGCNICPLTNITNCWDVYLVASKNYFLKALKEAPEYLL